MPVITKINTNSIADDAVTGDKFSGSGYLENTVNHDLSGTYSDKRLYTSDAYTVTGNVNVTGHLGLGTVSDGDVTLTNDSSVRTIEGSGTIASGRIINEPNTNLTGMTGVLGSGATGGSGLTALGTVTSGNLSNIDSSFQTYCAVPVVATTLSTAGGTGMTPINLYDIASSVGQPKTTDFAVDDQDDTISILTAGTYYASLMLFFAEDGISRDNYLVGTKAANAVPTPTTGQFLEQVFVNPGTNNSGTTCYFTTFMSGIVTFAENDRIKFFGRGVYNTQTIGADSNFNKSTVTLIKIN